VRHLFSHGEDDRCDVNANATRVRVTYRRAPSARIFEINCDVDGDWSVACSADDAVQELEVSTCEVLVLVRKTAESTITRRCETEILKSSMGKWNWFQHDGVRIISPLLRFARHSRHVD